jgi:hypothetical protein
MSFYLVSLKFLTNNTLLGNYCQNQVIKLKLAIATYKKFNSMVFITTEGNYCLFFYKFLLKLRMRDSYTNPYETKRIE